MNRDPVIEALEPAATSLADRTRFRALVVEAGEVSGAALATNIDSARVLVVIREAGTIRGVAALKRPQDTYRDKIAKRSHVALVQSVWPYELGYIYIEPELQGRGLSHQLTCPPIVPRS